MNEKAWFKIAVKQYLNTHLFYCVDEYVGVLISLWLFLFAAQPKEFFLDGLKKLEQWKCVELRGEYVNTFFQSHSCLFSL
jgi:hypothetical protein